MRLLVAIWLVLFAFLFGNTLCAQSPKITGETNYKAGQLVKLKAEGVSTKAAIRWRVVPDLVDRATTSRELCQFAALPGVYEVELLVITLTEEGAVDLVEQRHRVTIAGSSPPGPAPTPPGPAPTANPLAAIARITFDNAGCTACPIAPRRTDGRWHILTAAHCIENIGQRGTMRTKDNRSIKVTVSALNRIQDIAWLTTDEPIEQLHFAELAASNPAVGAEVWHAGFGQDLPGNVESGIVQSNENSQGKIQFLLSVSRGDSGGPIFEKSTGKVVSTVCCTTGLALKSPMYGGSAERARQLLESIKTADDAGEWAPKEMPKCSMIHPIDLLMKNVKGEAWKK